jgi:hypothetical protein
MILTKEKEKEMNRIVVLITGFALLMVWACSNQATNPDDTLSDEQAISALIKEIETSDTEDYFYADLNEEDESEFIEDESMLQKPIIPLRFGRIGLKPIVKDIRIVMTSDSTATAMFTKILRGHFVIKSMDSTYNWIRVAKKMGHEFKRMAHFVKRGREGEDLRKRWRLKEFSMVLGQSLGVVDSNIVRNTVDISKIIIETDTTVEIENPLEHMQTRKNIMTFAPGTEVTVTVFVENSSENAIQVPAGKGTELVRLHFARHRRWRDNRFYKHGIRHLKWTKEENGQNVYQGTWTVKNRFRVHHAAIDVIDNGTIFDDDIEMYPYNSVTWSTPYLIRAAN